MFNVFEIKLDIKKYVQQTQRYMPARADSIGSWDNILAVMILVITMTNVATICFTTDYLSRHNYSHRFGHRSSYLP